MSSSIQTAATGIDRDVVDAYHRFRIADSLMHARMRKVAGMNENELRVIEILVHASRAGRDVTPSDIARGLGIASASTTALLDRLERAGNLERVSHPTDRRSIYLAPTALAEEKLSATLDDFERRLLQVTADLPEEQLAGITAFLAALADAAADTAAN